MKYSGFNITASKTKEKLNSLFYIKENAQINFLEQQKVPIE